MFLAQTEQMLYKLHDGIDLKPGDEVITADFTFAALEVIALLQLTPVLLMWIYTI
jgi:dTDP-4-amino-4,6-dideoxygalactose transaminase